MAKESTDFNYSIKLETGPTHLMVEAFFISNYFDSIHSVGPEVMALEHLPKAALAHDRQDLVSIGQVIMGHYDIVPPVIVIAKVTFSHLLVSLNLWGSTTADKINLQSKKNDHKT